MAVRPKTKRKIAFIHMNDDSQKSGWREDEENIFYVAENLTGLWREIRRTRSAEHLNTKQHRQLCSVWDTEVRQGTIVND